MSWKPGNAWVLDWRSPIYGTFMMILGQRRTEVAESRKSAPLTIPSMCAEFKIEFDLGYSSTDVYYYDAGRVQETSPRRLGYRASVKSTSDQTVVKLEARARETRRVPSLARASPTRALYYFNAS